MSKRYNKRKQRDFRGRNQAQAANWERAEPDITEPDPSLFIQAYEADIVRGPQAWAAAPSLEVISAVDSKTTALIRWQPSGTASNGDEAEGVWVDRYAGYEISPLL